MTDKIKISDELKKEAELFLKNPDMFKEITEDEFGNIIVGEVNTRKAVFLQNCSTWVKGVVSHSLIGGESSSGKDYLTGNVLKIFPQDRIITRTKITPQAFTYWHESEDDWTWEDKIVYLPDITDNLINSPVFKCMATEGTFATVVRNGKSEDIEVKGIPNLIVTTAEANPNNEILNRFSLISLDESENQTLAIMEYEAKCSMTNDKYFYRSDIVQALRLLENVKVIIPYADSMVNFFPPNNIKLRRVFKNLLNLIKNSAALHQFQRNKTDKSVVIANEQDYEIARGVIENIKEQTISGVTAKEQRYLDKFEKALEEFDDDYMSVVEIHSNTEYKSLQTWWDVVKILEEKNLIEGKEFENTKGFKPIRKYKLKKIKKIGSLKLPEFKDLGVNKDNK